MAQVVHWGRALGAVLLLAGSLFSALAIVQAIRRRPTALALPAAVTALVLHEALLLPLLSVARWVTPFGICLGHLPLLAAGAALHRRVRLGRAFRAAARARWPLALAPVAILVVASGIEYPPNNWDAMTYHLARVAHWITNGSVLSFQTWQDRQNTFPPGAAYAVLLVDAVAGSDRLAYFVQLGAWLVIASAAPAWARVLGAPRRVAPLAGVLVATLPIAVLQASSTAYDLVACACALAVAGASLTLRRSPSIGEGLILGIALAGAWLVKATALVAALPFVAWAALRLARAARTRGGKARLAAALAASLLPIAAAIGMESFRLGAFRPTPGAEFAMYVYPWTGEWLDRASNVLRGLAHHLPIGDMLARISPVLAAPTGPGLGFGPEPLRAHEDYVGNPVQAALFLVAGAVALARFRKLPPRAVQAVACSMLAWVILHVVTRDNAWIGRLQAPTFVLGAGALGALAGTRARWNRGVAAVGAAASISFAIWIGCRNELRTPSLQLPDAVEARYADAPVLREMDDAALGVAAASGCRRIGLRIPHQPWLPDPWDYPLASRARDQGLETRHVFADDGWACVLLALAPPPPAEGWRWSGRAFTYVRAAPASP